MSTDQPQDVVSDLYDNYKETQREIFVMDSKRVRNSMFWVAVLLFGNDMLGLAIADVFTTEMILASLLFPAIYVGIGLLGLKQPMLAAILGALVFIGIIVIIYVAAGKIDGLLGIILKAIMIYFIFAAFQSARTAERAKKEMQ